MGRPTKFTHEELLQAHKRQQSKLMHAREDIKWWKKRAKEAEGKIEQYALIDKKPDYFFSFSGLLIFRRFYSLNGLTPMQVELLVIMSYCGMMQLKDLELYKKNHLRHPVPRTLNVMIRQGYVVKVKVQGKSKIRKRVCYTLTQKGKDIEADYERFYDEKMAELRRGKLTPFNFEDGAYFRRIYVSKVVRRVENGGKLPPNTLLTKTFIDQEEINQSNEK